MHEEENKKRLELLFKHHRDWLESAAINITKDKEEAEDLLSELYIYLLEKGTPKIYYKESFNLMYAHSFVKTRWLNRIKIKNRFQYKEIELEDTSYDYEWDNKLEETYTQVMDTFKDLEATKLWTASKLTSMYYFTDLTLEGLSNEIGISRSTTFLAVKKIKQHIRNNINNPFKDAKTK